MILVYTHKTGPRVNYIFKHIFTNILEVPVMITTKVDEFVAYNGPKITYAESPLGKEFFIRSHSLLFEQGISDVDIDVKDWEGIPAFFYAGEHSGIPFDIFAAAFYLLSRYEEYHPFVPDSFARFSPVRSSSFESGFIDIPVIDYWVLRLKDKLQEKFPGYTFPDRLYSRQILVDVNEAFAYRYKGLIRNTAGLIRDLVRLQFKKIIRRKAVMLRLKPDPYDIYKELIQTIKKHKTKVIFFFLFSEFTTFDTNVSYRGRAYRLLVKRIIDYVPFGQLFSYYTVNNLEKIQREKKRLEELAIRPVVKSRQHRYRLEIPGTYQNLVDAGIEEDYSMGYETHCGFRAGTCSPFYFYDLDYEIQTPLKIFPVAVNDRALMDVRKYTPEEARLHIEELQHRVKQVQGTFIMSIRNASFSEEYPKWKELFYRYITGEL